jgi:hypothetical protein
VGDEAVTLSLAVHRAGQHDQAGADAPVRGRERGAHGGDAGRAGPGGDELVAFGRGPTGRDDRPAALRERGAGELTARLGAEVGMLAFTTAVERWMRADNDEPFSLHAATALSDLQVRAADLDSRSRLSPSAGPNG